MSDDEKEDPFEDLERSVGEREGDPFERLDADEPETGAEDHLGGDGSPNDSQPFDQQKRESDGAPASEAWTDESAVTSEESPAGGDMAGEDIATAGNESSHTEDEWDGFNVPADVGSRDGEPLADVFEEMDVEEVDPDRVWEQLSSARSEGSVSGARERSYAEVSKHSYCEQCEHFSPPPDISCTHEEAEIVEFLDMETVRVIDCPVVAERKRLEEGDSLG